MPRHRARRPPHGQPRPAIFHRDQSAAWIASRGRRLPDSLEAIGAFLRRVDSGRAGKLRRPMGRQGPGIMNLVAVLYNDDAKLCRGAEVDRRAIAAVEGACDAVAEALQRTGFAVQKVPTGRSAAALVAYLDALRPGVVFNMGESFAGSTALEPHLAAMLELLGVPYTGNSPLTLALARDKALAQRLLEGYGLPVVKLVAVGNGDDLAESVLNGLTPPLFVKPRFEDASHGITSENFCASVTEARRQIGR